jgi:hypothetical protein
LIEDCSQNKSDITCPQCQEYFCFFHANAHKRGQCRTYIMKSTRDNMKSEAAIKDSSKPCAWCGAMTQKYGGCNHM